MNAIACKHNAKRGFSGNCDKCRDAAEMVANKGRRFVVERDGARVTIDPRFDVPNRAVGVTARLAMSEGDAISEGVYPWMPIRRDAEGYSPLECDTDAERIGSRILMDARGTAERLAYGMDARAERRRRVKHASRMLLRRVILAKAASAARFGARMLGFAVTRDRYARILAQSVENAAIEGAERIRVVRAVSKASPEVIERGWTRAMDIATRLAARLVAPRTIRETRPDGGKRVYQVSTAPTLSGRGAAMALCREARAFGQVSLTGYTTFAEAREALARGEIEATDPLAARLEGDDASPLQSVGACLSQRKVRGSRARNKRAADALARSEALRIEGEREGMAAMLKPLALYDLPLLRAELAEAIEGARLLRSKTARSKGKGVETGAMRRANCYIAAVSAEIRKREDDAARKALRAEAAERTENTRFQSAWRMGHPLTAQGLADSLSRPCATPMPIVCSSTGATKTFKIREVFFPRPTGELSCIVGGEGYAAFAKRALAYGYTPMVYSAPRQDAGKAHFGNPDAFQGSPLTAIGFIARDQTPKRKNRRITREGYAFLREMKRQSAQVKRINWRYLAHVTRRGILSRESVNADVSKQVDALRRLTNSGERIRIMSVWLDGIRARGERIMMGALGAALK